MSVDYVIQGGHPLRGRWAVKGSPVAAVAMVAAALLVSDKVTIQNVPHLPDLDRLIDELRGLDVAVDWTRPHEMTVFAAVIKSSPKVSPSHMVGWSPLLLAALVSRCDVVRLEVGELGFLDDRLVAFQQVLEKFGGKSEWYNGVLTLSIPHQHGVVMSLAGSQVEDTLVALLLAAVAEGESVLSNVATDPEVEDLLDGLGAMGVGLRRTEDDTIRVVGSRELHGTSHVLVADRFEAALIALAVAGTGGDVLVQGVSSTDMMSFLVKLRQIGVNYQMGRDGLRFWADSRSHFQAIQLQVATFPGLSMLWACLLLPMLCRSEGESVITLQDHQALSSSLQVLRSLGAEVHVRGNAVHLFGPVNLSASTIMAEDFPTSLAGLLVGMMAKGVTELRGVNELDGRFEELDRRLHEIGAQVKRIERA